MSDPAILDIPGCNTACCKRFTGGGHVFEIVLRAPEAAVNNYQDGVRAVSGGQPKVRKLKLIAAVMNPLHSLSPPAFEKCPKYCRAFVFTNAGNDLDTMVQTRVGQHVIDGTG